MGKLINNAKFWSENLKGRRDISEDIGVDGRII
jgi:hypothetical protein